MVNIHEVSEERERLSINKDMINNETTFINMTNYGNKAVFYKYNEYKCVKELKMLRSFRFIYFQNKPHLLEASYVGLTLGGTIQVVTIPPKIIKTDLSFYIYR